MTPEEQAKYDALDRERTRLEGITIEMGARNAKLERDNAMLKADLIERGKVNARLNRDLQRALRLSNQPDNA